MVDSLSIPEIMKRRDALGLDIRPGMPEKPWRFLKSESVRRGELVGARIEPN